jgi:hypothetical protein
LLDGGEGLDTGPDVNAVDEVAGAGIGDGVGHLGQNVLGIGQLDDRGLLGGPEGFSTTTQAVLVLGEELVEVLEEFGQATGGEGVVGLAVGSHEEAALGTTPSDEVAAPGDDGARQ